MTNPLSFLSCILITSSSLYIFLSSCGSDFPAVIGVFWELNVHCNIWSLSTVSFFAKSATFMFIYIFLFVQMLLKSLTQPNEMKIFIYLIWRTLNANSVTNTSDSFHSQKSKRSSTQWCITEIRQLKKNIWIFEKDIWIHPLRESTVCSFLVFYLNQPWNMIWSSP